MEAKDRLDYIYNYYNTNASKIEGLIKEKNPNSTFSKQTLYNIKKELTQTITTDVAENLMLAYPELDFVWLTTGKGSMLKSNNIENTNINGHNNFANTGSIGMNIINSNIAKNVKGNLKQINGGTDTYSDNENLKLENIILKQKIESLENQINQYERTIKILEKVIENGK